MELSVVICTRNRPQDLRVAVSSILGNHAELRDGTAKLWIIDDGSLSEELIRDLRDATTQCGWAFGYANKSGTPGLLRSRVYAKNLIRSGWILFLDDDIEMQPGYLERLRNLAAVPGLAGAGGVDLLGKRQSFPRRLYEYSIGFRAFRRGHLSISGFGGDMDRWILEKAPFETEFLYGCNMAFRADALRSLDGHAAFESYSVGEDMLLSGIARRHGKLMVDPQMQVKHFQSPLARDKTEQISYMQVVNHFHLLEATGAGRARKAAVLVTAAGLAALFAAKIVFDLIRGKQPDFGKFKGNCRGLRWLAGALLSDAERRAP